MLTCRYRDLHGRHADIRTRPSREVIACLLGVDQGYRIGFDVVAVGVACYGTSVQIVSDIERCGGVRDGHRRVLGYPSVDPRIIDIVPVEQGAVDIVLVVVIELPYVISSGHGASDVLDGQGELLDVPLCIQRDGVAFSGTEVDDRRSRGVTVAYSHFRGVPSGKVVSCACQTLACGQFLALVVLGIDVRDRTGSAVQIEYYGVAVGDQIRPQHHINCRHRVGRCQDASVRFQPFVR